MPGRLLAQALPMYDACQDIDVGDLDGLFESAFARVAPGCNSSCVGASAAEAEFTYDDDDLEAIAELDSLHRDVVVGGADLSQDELREFDSWCSGTQGSGTVERSHFEPTAGVASNPTAMFVNKWLARTGRRYNYAAGIRLRGFASVVVAINAYNAEAHYHGAPVPAVLHR